MPEIGEGQGPGWGTPPPDYPPADYPPAGPPPGYPPHGYPPPYGSGFYVGQGPYPPPPGPWPSGAPWMAHPLPLAGYGVRLAGWLIDWIVLIVVDVPLLLVTHSIHRTHEVVINNGAAGTQTNFHTSPGGLALGAIISIAYGTLLCGSRRGQTLGMMLVGTRVIDEHTGGPIGMARGAGRAAFEYLMAVLLFIPWIIDMLFPLWDAKKQTLHDKVTRAVVVAT